MFKQLRIKFIAVVMASVAVVLAVTFTGICMVEYQRSSSSVEMALTNAIEHASNDRFGEFGQGGMGQFGPFGADSSDDERELVEGDGATGAAVADASAADEDDTGGAANAGDSTDNSKKMGSSGATANGEDAAGADDDPAASDGSGAGGLSGAGAMAGDDGGPGAQGMGPRIGRGSGERNAVPVAVYSYSKTSSYTMVSGSTTASIESDVLESATARIADASDGSGTLSDLGLHYKKKTTETATFVAFADDSTTDSWKQLALTLLVAGIGILAVFFVISLFLSKWALAPVREAWDAQRQFVADASHDLKTPLTVILANASILLKHPDRTIASESQWIESTQVEARQMQGLVNEMLELAQVEAGRMAQSAPHEPVDLSDLVDGESLLFDSVALEQSCLFECEVEEGIGVTGDEARLHKMVSTLVENAFKYVNPGGRVDIRLARSGRNAVLSVRNTGSVIGPDDLPHIFDRFYRTDKARTSGTGGFGLGLAIAREIARAHDGDITCASNESEGTTFTVTLPLSA